MPLLMKLILDSLLEFSLNFFDTEFKILLDEKQIRFYWNHFDENYFTKIIELNKGDFKYKNRKSKGLLGNRKIEKFDWNKKIEWLSVK